MCMRVAFRVARTAALSAPFGARVFPVRSADDAEAFSEWLSTRTLVAVDTEATGLDVFCAGWRLRLTQIGDAGSAWVFEAGGEFESVRRAALYSGVGLIFHNAPFDLHALGMLDLFPFAFDTAMMSHLVDPSRRHGLKGLTTDLLGSDAGEGEKLLKAHFSANGWTGGTGWAEVDLRNEDYVRYAGLDAVLTFRLFEKLKATIEARGMGHLLAFERRLAHLMAKLTDRGMLVDKAYAAKLGVQLTADAQVAEDKAAMMGVSNPRSGKQIREALLLAGVKLTKRTPTGEFSTAEAVLETVDHPLAEAVLDLRSAQKSNKAYVAGTLELLGVDGRSHPWIRPLGARTGRMSVSKPPLQQLPSGDPTIRRMFVADPGNLMGASDYQGVELRVLAALAQEKVMLQAFKDGADLHQMTADAARVSRKVGKMANFLTVYGGGPTALASQAKISPAEAKKALRGFDRAYPGVKRWSDTVQSKAARDGYMVTTVTGRVLPLDRDRIYAAVNYLVQSTARDILAQAILRIEEAGMFDNVLMLVHDEVLWQAPKAEAEEFAVEMGRIMSVDDFYGVAITTDSEVYGPNWGSGYE